MISSFLILRLILYFRIASTLQKWFHRNSSQNPLDSFWNCKFWIQCQKATSYKFVKKCCLSLKTLFRKVKRVKYSPISMFSIVSKHSKYRLWIFSLTFFHSWSCYMTCYFLVVGPGFSSVRQRLDVTGKDDIIKGLGAETFKGKARFIF